MKLGLTADEVLTTTRAVRKRLDLSRPVEREVILECLEIALQAPDRLVQPGLVVDVRDRPGQEAGHRRLLRRQLRRLPERSRLAAFPDGDLRAERRDAIRSSSDYLRDHFHEVPVLLIPLLEGRLEGLPVFGAASSWGSLLPAVWSFMLALRERGLGSAWTTLHLPNEREVAELLGIPYDRYTQAGLFPIAYTIGTDFKPAPRLDVDELVHWDTW